MSDRVGEAARRHNVPGLSLAVGTADGLVHSAAYGEADLARRTPLTSDTRFRAGSLTKLVTAAAILRLRDRGGISLDLPVSGLAAPITLRQLLSHASGLPRGAYRREPIAPAELRRRLGRTAPVFPPGSRRKYSNLGFAAAGVELAQAAGGSYREAVTELVLEPLGMTRSRIARDDEAVSGLAVGYQTDHYRSLIRAGDRLAPAPPLAAFSPAGGLVCTPCDYLALLTALFGGFLRAGSVNELRSPQPPARSSVERGYSLGARVARRFERLCLHHGGGHSGYSSLFLAFPEVRVAGVAMANRCCVPLREVLYGAMEPWLTAAGVAVKAPAARGEPLLGVYTDRDGRTLEISWSGERPAVRRDGSVSPLRPYHRDVWIDEAGLFDWPLRFASRRGLVWEGSLGPRRLVRDGPYAPLLLDMGAAAPPNPALDPAVPGVYRHPDVGDTHLFEREGELYWSFYFADEARLERLSADEYRLAGGMFAGEPLRLRRETGRCREIEAAGMRFSRRDP